MEGNIRTIDELLARYSVEPSLANKDIYVEGAFDADLLKMFIRDQKLNDVVPYEIGTIQIPDTTLIELGLTSGNRQKVIALALALGADNSKWGPICCIVDLDEEQLLGTAHKKDGLLYTDDTAMELYVIDEESVEKVIFAVGGISELTGNELITLLSPIARELFLGRVAAKSLGWMIDWTDWDNGKYCKVGKATINFDLKKYFLNCLISNGKGKEYDAFAEKLLTFHSEVSKVNQLFFRGHDFGKLLELFLRKNGKQKQNKLDSELILRMLMASTELKKLGNTNLFNSVKNHVHI